MKIASRENFRFTDKRLAAGLFICAPWLLLIALGIADPHQDGTAIWAMLSGLSGIVCAIWAAVRKTEQSLFLLLTGLVSMIVALTPFVCVAH
jgi:hypothetical protein